MQAVISSPAYLLPALCLRKFFESNFFYMPRNFLGSLAIPGTKYFIFYWCLGAMSFKYLNQECWAKGREMLDFAFPLYKNVLAPIFNVLLKDTYPWTSFVKNKPYNCPRVCQ